jgi:uncharacterized protein YecT (DUF1311 family)
MKVVPLLLLISSSALAQETMELVNIYGPLLTQCYEEAEGREAKTQCIGALTSQCMAVEEGGETTVGMSMCNNAETEFWDEMWNAEYRLTMAWAKAHDVEEAKYFPEYANLAKSLRDAQRAWITFRDAECGLAYAVWGSGSMRHIAGSGCILDMTAERAIELRAKREMFE